MRKLTSEEKASRGENRTLYKRQWYLANRERVLAVNQAYREKNPELIARLKKEWTEVNKERIREMARERDRSKPKEERLAEGARYRTRQGETLKNKQKEYYKRNKARLLAAAHKRHAENRDEINERQRVRVVQRWLKIAGWSQAEYERRLGLGCEICGKKVPRNGKSGLVFDHDHETGQVRGLLCAHCNKFLDWAIEHYEVIGCYHRSSLEAAA